MAEDRILFVADDRPDAGLPQWTLDAFDGATVVHVITPVLGTRIERATDSDEPTRRAAERLKDVLAHIGSIGADVTGEVITDPPFEAVQRMLLDNTYDRIVLGMRQDTHWKEDNLAAKLFDITDTPISEITLGSD